MAAVTGSRAGLLRRLLRNRVRPGMRSSGSLGLDLIPGSGLLAAVVPGAVGAWLMTPPPSISGIGCISSRLTAAQSVPCPTPPLSPSVGISLPPEHRPAVHEISGIVCQPPSERLVVSMVGAESHLALPGTMVVSPTLFRRGVRKRAAHDLEAGPVLARSSSAMRSLVRRAAQRANPWQTNSEWECRSARVTRAKAATVCTAYQI